MTQPTTTLHADPTLAPQPSAAPVAGAPSAAAPEVVVATYASYADAQRAVDSLSDRQFDVSGIQIVGRGLHSVERVTGRLTNGRAALAGAASGAWFGLFIGLLFGILTPGLVWLSALLWSILVGAVFGAVFGWVGHLVSGGRRDFASVSSITADQYSIVVPAAVAGQAASLLAR